MKTIRKAAMKMDKPVIEKRQVKIIHGIPQAKNWSYPVPLPRR